MIRIGIDIWQGIYNTGVSALCFVEKTWATIATVAEATWDYVGVGQTCEKTWDDLL